MSDVSGIPYMGPQGVGNLYAPLFPASGMSTPSAAQISYNWAPEGNYSQNVTNNLFSSGGGFGKQTDYYSQLGAQYSAMGMSPFGIFSEGGGGGGGSGGGDTSPFSYGGYGTSNQGGGYTAPSVNDPSINWGQLFGGGGGGSAFAPPSNYDTFQGGWGNVSNTMPQGGAYQGMAKAIDWGNLFGGGGGAQQQTPQQPTDYGSLFGAGFSGAPNAAPAQQQPVDYGSLFGRGVGGSTTEPDPRANEPTVADPNRATYGGYGQGGATSALPDYMTNNQLPAELRPSAPPEAGSRTYDFAPMFEAGGGGGIGTGGTTSQLFGSQAGSLGGSAFSYNPYATGAQDTSTAGPSASDLQAQARARLADLVTGAPDKVAEETAKTVGGPGESAREAGGPVTSDAATGNIPLPPVRPEGADVARPPAAVPQFPAARLAPNGKEPEAFIVHHTGSRTIPENVVSGWRTDRPGVGSQYIMDRNGVIHDTLNEYGYGGTGHIDPRYTGTIPGSQGLSNHNVVGMEIVANNDADMTPAQVNALKQFAAQNYPDTPFYGHSEVSTNRENEGIRGSQDILQERPPLFNFDWSNAPIPDPAAGPPLRPSADIPNAPAVKAGPSGVEKSQTFLNRPLENILQQYAPDKISQAGMFIDLKQPLREALKGPFGSQILEGLQPKLGDVGLTRSDFAKAVANPAARFGDAVFGTYTGPEDHSGGYPEFRRQDASIEDRRGEPEPSAGLFNAWADKALNKGQDIADNVWRTYGPQEDPGELGRALGYDDIMTTPLPPVTPEMVAQLNKSQAVQRGPDLEPPAPDMSDFKSPANDYSMFQQPASRADLASLVADPNRAKMDFSGFSPSPEPRRGGVGPEATLEPDFMDAIQEVESSGNPNKVTNSYKGLYQLDDAEFRKYGGTGSIFDPEENTKAAGAKMVDEGQRVQDILGRALTPPEQYMVHQQGVAGALAHLNNPDQLAWKNFQGAASSSEARAKEAIWGNMTPEMKAQFGNDVNNVTSRDFLRMWDDRYYGILNR